MYYWTVTAHNQNGDRQPLNGMYYSFTVKESTEVPGPFTMSTVYNGTDNASLTPKIGWTKSSHADSYVIQISETEDFSDVLEYDCSDYDEMVLSEFLGQVVGYYYTYWPEEMALKPETKYYCRILAKNEHGTRLMNGLTHEFTTTTENGKPADFQLTYPENGAVLEPRGTLRWEDSNGSFFWHLEIAHDPEFTDKVLDQEFISYPAYTVSADLLGPDTTYYWRVTASNREIDEYQREYTETSFEPMSTPSSSGVYSFTTSSTPAAPTVKTSSPFANGGLVIWEPVPGADSYTVAYGTESGNYSEQITDIQGDRCAIRSAEPVYCTSICGKGWSV